MNTPASRVTTLDVWDTLIRRACHPDEVKLATAHFLRTHHGNALRAEYQTAPSIFERRRAAELAIGNQNRAEGHDDEYCILDVFERALDEMLRPEHSSDARRIAQAAKEFELAFEAAITYPDPGIRELLVREGVSEAHILSDFYVSEPELLALVRTKHPELALASGMVSCDQGVTKRSGRLYKRFQRLHGIEPAQHMHIGDNLAVDVHSAERVGVSALHYQNAAEERKRAKFAAEFEARMKGDYSAYWAALVREAQRALEAKGGVVDSRARFGAEVAPLFVLYVLFALEQATTAGVETVYYFTREGEILAKVHEAIAKALPERRLPRPQVLEVSRLATFGASISDISLPELGRFWTMYPRHSVRTLLTSLGLSTKSYETLIWDVGLDPELVLVEPWKDPRFLKLLQSHSFTQQVNRDLAARRSALLEYLAQFGLTTETKRAVVVEIGWRGTIQDNLARVLSGTQIEGVYLALFRYLNSQPENCRKTAFLFDDNRGDTGERVLSPQAPVEMLFNSPTGSVTGYAREGGRSVATRKSAEGEDRIWHAFTGTVQAGVLDATPHIVRLMQTRALSATELRKQAQKQAARLLTHPAPEFARAYFKLEHNETFGVGGFVSKESQLLKELYQKGSLEKAWKWMADRPRASGWPAGYKVVHTGVDASELLGRLAASQKDLKRIPKLLGRISREVSQGTRERGLVPVLVDIRDAFVKKPPVVSEGMRMIPLVQDAELHDEALLHFNARMQDARATASGPMVVAWLFPDIGLGSGGHMTLLRFVRYFKSLGILNKVYIHGKSRHRDREALERFVRRHYGPTEGIEFYENSESIDDSDILIATHWTTAYEVFRRTNTRFKAYFIQDFEPFFYAKSSLSVFSENTYAMNLFGVCASPWLYLVARRYGMEACSFHLGYEPKTYFVDPLAERDLNRIVVYMRPSTERRGTELLLAALLIVQKERPQTRISIFGTGKIPEVGLKAENMGLLNEEQLRRLHSGSALTVLTSLTNYSLMPIEAMACGSVVIDLDVESMRATFEEDAPIRLVKPDPQAMAQEILELLRNREQLAELSQASIRYAQGFQWKRAFQQVQSALFAEYFKGVPRSKEAPKAGLVRPRGGEQAFRVSKKGRVRHMDASEVSGSVRTIEPRSLLALPVEPDESVPKPK